MTTARTDLSAHPFSPESIAYEGGASCKSERAWLGFAAECERLLGHTLDGNDVDAKGCGYSLDEAMDRFLAGAQPFGFVALIKSRKRYRKH